jgi:hypothetical protein
MVKKKMIETSFISPETEAELKEVQDYHTKTYKKIDKLARRILKNDVEYERTVEISTWEQIIKLLIDEYWRSSERLDENELIATFEQE